MKGPNEIDVIYKKGHELIPIEIKSSKTFHLEFLKKLQFFQEITKGRAPKGYLIYAGEIEQTVHNCHILNYKNAITSILK